MPMPKIFSTVEARPFSLLLWCSASIEDGPAEIDVTGLGEEDDTVGGLFALEDTFGNLWVWSRAKVEDELVNQVWIWTALGLGPWELIFPSNSKARLSAWYTFLGLWIWTLARNSSFIRLRKKSRKQCSGQFCGILSIFLHGAYLSNAAKMFSWILVFRWPLLLLQSLHQLFPIQQGTLWI